jgi:transcriptional regulator with XRE-family HTH domain
MCRWEYNNMFNENLKTLREAKRLSQDELATQLNVEVR